MRSGAIRLAVSVLAALVPLAAAQTVELAGVATTVHGYAGSVAVLDMRERDLTADLRFGVIPAPGGNADVSLSARIARGATLAGLGAATLGLELAARTDGRGAAHLSGQAVLGPASVRLGVAAGNAEPGAFAASGMAPADPSLRTAGAYVGADAAVRYRIDRTFLLAIEPAAAWGAAGVTVRGRASLRVRRLVEPFDGLVAAHSHLLPGGGGWSGALGIGTVWAPRRAPEWQATVWLGWLRGALTPGISVEGAATLTPGLSVSLGLAAEPFRADVPPYRGALEVQVGVGAHRAFGRAEVEAEAGHAAQVALATGFRFSLAGDSVR